MYMIVGYTNTAISETVNFPFTVNAILGGSCCAFGSGNSTLFFIGNYGLYSFDLNTTGTRGLATYIIIVQV